MRGSQFVVLALAAALFAGLSAAQSVDYEPARTTRCWECHVNDFQNVPAPLRSFWNVVPPEATDVRETATPFQVTVQNSWYHDIRYLESSLDISAAPSLKFFDGRDPIESFVQDVIERRVGVEPATPPEVLPEVHGVADPATGHTTIVVPSGATSLRLEMRPLDDRFQPEVAWTIHPGRSSPGDDPPFGPIYAEPGEAAVFTRDSVADFAGFGYGNWTIQGEVAPMDRDGNPNPFGDRLPFRVDYVVRFDASEVPVSIQSTDARIGPEGTHLFQWDLQNTATPAPGEAVTLTVNGAVFWDHEPRSNAIDWENVTSSIDIPLLATGSGARLEPDQSQLIVIVPEPFNGASLVTVSEAVGYASAFLIASSIVTGGMFGKASRRALNGLFGSAKRRVAFHNFLSYGLLAAAIAHTVLFLYTALAGGSQSWTLGIIWGGAAILCMIGLAVTGAMQVPMIRRWDYGTWRWTHFWLAIGAIVFTIVHMLLDGAHFGAVQEWVGWSDPLDFRPEAG